MERKVSVFDVAKYILSKRGHMTTMKLQKLCYYAQAWYLAWEEVPLFDEDFEAWANGPVCRVLYNTHRHMFDISASDLGKGNQNNLSLHQKEDIDIVLETYGGKEPSWLSGLTHMERPWKEARNGVEAGEPCSNIISKETMRDYYSGLLNGQE